MHISLTIRCDLSTAKKILDVCDGTEAQIESEVKQHEAEDKKAEAEVVKATKPKAVPKPKKEAPASPPDDDEIDIVAVRAMAKKLVAAKRGGELKELFGKFEATKLSEVSADNLPEFVEQLTVLVGE